MGCEGKQHKRRGFAMGLKKKCCCKFKKKETYCKRCPIKAVLLARGVLQEEEPVTDKEKTKKAAKKKKKAEKKAAKKAEKEVKKRLKQEKAAKKIEKATKKKEKKKKKRKE